MPDLSQARLESVRMRLVTEVEGHVFEEKIGYNEKFMADLIVAIRNNKSPADALSFLADVGSDHLNDPEVQIAKANRMGTRR